MNYSGIAKFTLGSLILLSVGGCVTTPISKANAGSPKIDRVADREYLTPKSGARSITFIRDSGLIASLAYAHIFIDGRHIASLGSSEALEVFLPPRKHQVEVGFGRELDIRPIVIGSPAALTLDATPDMRFNVRIGFNKLSGPLLSYNADPK